MYLIGAVMLMIGAAVGYSKSGLSGAIGYTFITSIFVIPAFISEFNKERGIRKRRKAEEELAVKVGALKQKLNDSQVLKRVSQCLEGVLREFPSPHEAALGLKDYKLGELIHSRVCSALCAELPDEDQQSVRRYVADRLGSTSAAEQLFRKLDSETLAERPWVVTVRELSSILETISKAENLLKKKIEQELKKQSKLIRGQKEVDSMSGLDFEHLIAEIFEGQGFEVTMTPQSGDFGVDLLIKQSGVITAVQCKRYKTNSSVGAEDILKLKGGESFYAAHQMLLVTSSSLSRNALEACERLNVSVWTRDRLFAEIEKSGIYERSAKLDEKIKSYRMLLFQIQVRKNALDGGVAIQNILRLVPFEEVPARKAS